MTKDLAPDKDTDSPLRKLDWTDDDYTMELVSGRIYDRDVNDIMDNLALLNDRGGDTVYFPSMAESGEHVIRVSVPPKVLLLIEQVALKYHDLDLSDAIRIHSVHGMSIYEHKIGAEIEKLYYDSVDEQAEGDEESVMACLLNANINFAHTSYTCRYDSRMFQLISRFASHAGCKKQCIVGIWVLYSFKTHPRLKKWHKQIDDILNQFESSMTFRIKLLNSS